MTSVLTFVCIIFWLSSSLEHCRTFHAFRHEFDPIEQGACYSTTADAGIRDHVVQAVELKFNCFFLMPVVDTFPTKLREELEAAYDEDIDEVFDVTAVRNALESRLKSLESELHQVQS